MLGSIIGAVGNLVGGLMGRDAASDANRENIKQQRQFAQEGIQWRVADAKKAGIHPLYALGAQTASFAPSSVGDPLGGAISDMGQNIGRAVDAAADAPTRAAAKIMTGLQLERAGLENELLKSQIATQRAQIGPPMPGGVTAIDGQGDTQKAVRLPDGTILPATNVSSAQAVEDRSGEIADVAYGISGVLEYLKHSKHPIIAETRKELETIIRNINLVSGPFRRDRQVSSPKKYRPHGRGSYGSRSGFYSDWR